MRQLAAQAPPSLQELHVQLDPSTAPASLGRLLERMPLGTRRQVTHLASNCTAALGPQLNALPRLRSLHVCCRSVGQLLPKQRRHLACMTGLRRLCFASGRPAGAYVSGAAMAEAIEALKEVLHSECVVELEKFVYY
ncbi:hypothetical protein N2152v2_010543 [Parachlorella kessleri]